jgi:hypothetical protein
LVSLAANSSVNNPNVEVITPTSTGNINTINNNINMTITNTFDSSSNNSVVVRSKSKLPKLSSGVPSTLTFGPFGLQEYINIGATPNDGNGDPLRVAFGKINNNFTNLFFTTTTTSTAYTLGLTPNQVILEVPVSRFYQGEFQIRSSDGGTPDMQNITLSASITNNLAGVRFSGHSTLFQGNAICRYDMDVFNGNVRILINQLIDIGIEHFISAYVTYPDPVVIQGTEIALDGYGDNFLLGTESELILTTEN